jgi:hypothetical protein
MVKLCFFSKPQGLDLMALAGIMRDCREHSRQQIREITSETLEEQLRRTGIIAQKSTV